MRMKLSMMNNMHLLIRLVSPILGFFWTIYTQGLTPLPIKYHPFRIL